MTKQIKSEHLKTILTITLGFIVVYYITKWQWALSLSLIVGLLGLFSEYIAKKIDFLWMKLTQILALIIPNVLLSVIFFIFLTPIAFLSRIFGDKNVLSLKNTTDSLFKNSNKQYDKKSFENPW